jgi:phosphatidylinositol-3-phosphatase
MTIQMPKPLAKLLPVCGLLGIALLAVACRGGSEAARGGDGPGAKLARAADQGLRKAVGLPLKGFTTVFTIVLENQDYEDVLGPAGKRNAPYINSLAASYGLATNYHDSGAHPSLPNYLYMVSGSTHGVRFDVLPNHFGLPLDGENLGIQLERAGIAWRSYQESMGRPCLLDAHRVDAVHIYAPRHDPFLYFRDIQTNRPLCERTNVDYGQLAVDLAGGAYRYMWITPDLHDDGHDPQRAPAKGLAQSDAWCAAEVPKILASPTFKAGGVLFLTWDEAEGRAGHSRSQIPMIVVSPSLKHTRSNEHFTHASYLATVEEIFGLEKLGAAKTATSMVAAFFQ